MKLNLKDKNVKIAIITLLVILVPILFNQGKSIITGLIMSYQMSLPKDVEVMKPIEDVIEPEFETTGRIEAKNSIDVIARVNGWLEKRFFDEGDVVKKGQKLFQIQPDEYRLAMQDASARVNENQAVYQNSVIDYNRAASLIKEDMVSREYYDNALATKNKNKAALDAAIAQFHKAKLDLSYTNITAPMDGRVGKAFISEGNYVTASSGVLTSIYRTSPIQVKFSVKSADYIYIKKYLSNHDGNNVQDLDVEVRLKLADGSIYDQIGRIEYMDNKISEETGTITFRAIFDNPMELLVPGDFVNVILKLRVPRKVMLIPQSATKTDIGTGYYVWVVQDGKAVKKNIVVEQNINNNWVVESGLDYTDDVVVKGIQDIYQSGQPLKAKQYKPEDNKEGNLNNENK